jgi:hypothetical protein
MNRRYALGLVLVLLCLLPWTHAAPDPIALKIQGPDTIGNVLPTTVAGVPANSTILTPIIANATVANASISTGIPPNATKFSYLTGFQVTGMGATAATNVEFAVNNGSGTILHYEIAVPAGATTSIIPLVVTFNPPISSSAINTSIQCTMPAFGLGNTTASVAVQGFQQ